MIDNQSPFDGQNEMDVGKQFRQARENLNLSLEDVSKEIHLRPSILKCIEDNKLNTLSTSPTFVKGYIRNYARFLDLPESVWEALAVSLDESLKNNLGKDIKTIAKVNTYSSNHRWLGYITVLVISVVIGMMALWWWENYQQLNEEREKLVNSYISDNNNSASDVTLNKLDNIDISNDIATPLPSEVNPNTGGKDVSLSDVESENTQKKIVSNEVFNNENSTKNQAIEESELKIEITGTSCWLSVKDNKGKTLAQKEYNQGEMLTFTKGAPYSLIIGAPNNVKVTYKGEEYPLIVDGRVAKFKLQ